MQYASNLQKGSIELRSSSQGRHNGCEIDSRGAFLFSNPCLLHIFSHVLGTIFDESAAKIPQIFDNLAKNIFVLLGSAFIKLKGDWIKS